MFFAIHGHEKIDSFKSNNEMEYPQLYVVFNAKGIFFYGIDDIDLKNDHICMGVNVINLRERCIAQVSDRDGHLRQCGMQTSALYTLIPNDPHTRRCPVHYAQHIGPNASACMSQAMNNMCDQMRASLFQRELFLTLQHINHFLGDLWATKQEMFEDPYLHAMLRANCSASFLDTLIDRSTREDRVTIDGFGARQVDDMDHSSDFEDDSSDDDSSDDDPSDDDSPIGGEPPPKKLTGPLYHLRTRNIFQK